MWSSNPVYLLSSTVPKLPPTTNAAGESPCKPIPLEVFPEEDRNIDASVMRHVKRVLVQNDDSDARWFQSFFSFGNKAIDAALPQQNCSTTAPHSVLANSKGSKRRTAVDEAAAGSRTITTMLRVGLAGMVGFSSAAFFNFQKCRSLACLHTFCCALSAHAISATFCCAIRPHDVSESSCMQSFQARPLL